MKLIKLTSLLIILIFNPIVYAEEIAVLSKNSTLENVSLGDWGGKWWQWALQFDEIDSPVSDLIGGNCFNGQVGNVWFLAGSYSTNPIVRKCEIPKGKTLFFPIINSIYLSTKEHPVTCQDAITYAKQMMQPPSNLYLKINNKVIADPSVHREASTNCFDPYELFAKVNNLKKIPPGFPAASDGYWIAIKPLPTGKYTLSFGGQVPSFRQLITYELTVN